MGFSRASKNLIYEMMGKLKYVAKTTKKKLMTDNHSQNYEKIGNDLFKKKI